MPQKAKDILGVIGKVLAVIIGCATVCGFLLRVLVLNRIEAGESKIAALEAGQLAQDVRFSECLHSINMHLLSLDMNVSNALQILKDHQMRISALPNYETGQAKSKSGW